MGKLMVVVAHFLSLCALLLALPAVVTAQHTRVRLASATPPNRSLKPTPWIAAAVSKVCSGRGLVLSVSRYGSIENAVPTAPGGECEPTSRSRAPRGQGGMKKAMMILIMYSLFWSGGLNAASAILLVDSGPGAMGGPNIFATDPISGGIPQFLAQEFTLPNDATIAEIAPFLGRVGTGPDPMVTVQLTNAIGPGTQPSAVLFETSLTVSNPLASIAFLPISTSFFLKAGTYFLVLSSNAELANSAVWGQDAPTDIGPDFRAFGSDINFTFPPASIFMGDFGDDLALRISGNPIPEPVSCDTTIPFRWPSEVGVNFLGQDYAQFNWGRSRHHHTGIDIGDRRKREVFAAATGEVIAVCSNGVEGGCVFGGERFSNNVFSLTKVA
jgi:hypothetical protein